MEPVNCRMEPVCPNIDPVCPNIEPVHCQNVEPVSCQRIEPPSCKSMAPLTWRDVGSDGLKMISAWIKMIFGANPIPIVVILVMVSIGLFLWIYYPFEDNEALDKTDVPDKSIDSRKQKKKLRKNHKIMKTVDYKEMDKNLTRPVNKSKTKIKTSSIQTEKQIVNAVRVLSEKEIEVTEELRATQMEGPSIGTLRSILREDVDINCLDGLGLRQAIRFKHDDIWKQMLYKKNVNVNMQGKDHLDCRCTAYGYHACTEAAVADGLHEVYQRNDFTKLNQITSIPLRNGETPLHTALSVNNMPAIRMLLNRSDINVNLQDAIGRTPLMVALHHNNISAADLLLRRFDIQVNCQDKLQRSALHYAANNDNANSLSQLLSKPDIDVNLKDFAGMTAITMSGKNWVEKPKHTIVTFKMLLADERVNIKNEFEVITLFESHCGHHYGHCPNSWLHQNRIATLIELVKEEKKQRSITKELENNLKDNASINKMKKQKSKYVYAKHKEEIDRKVKLLEVEIEAQSKVKCEGKNGELEANEKLPYKGKLRRRQGWNYSRTKAEISFDQKMGQIKNSEDDKLNERKFTEEKEEKKSNDQIFAYSNEKKQEETVTEKSQEDTKETEVEIMCNCTFEKSKATHGFIEVTCSEKCSVTYHMECWRMYLQQLNIKLEKNVLNENCNTPDCWGTIVKAVRKDKFGNVKKYITVHKIQEKNKKTNADKIVYHQLKKESRLIKKTDNLIPSILIQDDETSKIENKNIGNKSSSSMDTLLYAIPQKIVTKKREPEVANEVGEPKRKSNKKNRNTMSLAEYQFNFLGKSLTTEFKFVKFNSVIEEIMQKYHIQYKKAREILRYYYGYKAYIKTKELEALFSSIEKDLIREQEAITEDIYEQSNKYFITEDDDWLREAEECPICLKDIKDEKKTVLDCGHEYHSQCIKRWFLERLDCPLCREYVKPVDEFPLLL